MASPILQRVEKGLDNSDAQDFIGEQPQQRKGTLHKAKQTAHTPSKHSVKEQTAVTAAAQGRQQDGNSPWQCQTSQSRDADT